MTQFKYIKRGVKRRHQIIDGILDMLEEMAKIDGVKKVIPAKISYSPKRCIIQPKIKFQMETVSGFKLMAHSKGAIQEIFVVVELGERDYVRKIMRALFG